MYMYDILYLLKKLAMSKNDLSYGVVSPRFNGEGSAEILPKGVEQIGNSLTIYKGELLQLLSLMLAFSIIVGKSFWRFAFLGNLRWRISVNCFVGRTR